MYILTCDAKQHMEKNDEKLHWDILTGNQFNRESLKVIFTLCQRKNFFLVSQH